MTEQDPFLRVEEPGMVFRFHPALHPTSESARFIAQAAIATVKDLGFLYPSPVPGTTCQITVLGALEGYDSLKPHILSAPQERETRVILSEKLSDLRTEENLSPVSCVVAQAATVLWVQLHRPEIPTCSPLDTNLTLLAGQACFNLLTSRHN